MTHPCVRACVLVGVYACVCLLPRIIPDYHTVATEWFRRRDVATCLNACEQLQSSPASSSAVDGSSGAGTITCIHGDMYVTVFRSTNAPCESGRFACLCLLVRQDVVACRGKEVMRVLSVFPAGSTARCSTGQQTPQPASFFLTLLTGPFEQDLRRLWWTH